MILNDMSYDMTLLHHITYHFVCKMWYPFGNSNIIRYRNVNDNNNALIDFSGMK